MTDRPINLNKARKARALTEKRAKADANAVKFGRTKAERTQQAAEAGRKERLHSGHLLRPVDKEPGE